MKQHKESKEQKMLRQYRQEKPGYMMKDELEELLKLEHADHEPISVAGFGMVSANPIMIDTSIGEMEAAEVWNVWRRDHYIILGDEVFAKERDSLRE